MKKYLSVILAVFMLLSAFAGCVETKEPEENPPSSSDGTEESVTPDEPVTPHAHIWDDGIITKEANCGEAGIKAFYCDCGEIKTEEIAPFGEHTWDMGIVSGTVKTYSCAVCGSTKTEEIEDVSSKVEAYIVVANHRWSIITTGSFTDDSAKTTSGLDGITYNRFMYHKVESLAGEGQILAVKIEDIPALANGSLDRSKILSLDKSDVKGELVGTEILVAKDGEGKITSVLFSDKSVVGELRITEKDGKYTVKLGDKVYLENASADALLSPLVYSYSYSGLSYFSSLNQKRVFISPDTMVDLHTIYSNETHSISDVGNFYDEFYNVRRTLHQVVGYDWNGDGQIDALVLNDGTVAKTANIDETKVGLRSNGTNAGYCGHGWCTGSTLQIGDVILNHVPKVDEHVLAYGDYQTGKVTVNAVTEIVGTLTSVDWEKGVCIIDGKEYEICIGGETPYGYSANPYRWESQALEQELLGNKIMAFSDGKYIVHFVETALEKNIPLASAETFEVKDIFTPELYRKGVVLTGDGTNYTIKFDDSLNSYAYILPVYLGKCYEVRFSSIPQYVRVAHITANPANIQSGSKIDFSKSSSFLYFNGTPTENDQINFLYVPNYNEYLVIYTGADKPDLYIGEQVIIAESDSEGTYWEAPTQGSIYIEEECAMGDRDWDTETFLNNMYEPIRAKYPEYITRSVIGTDQSGKHNMYSYVYTPENYKITIFLASGIHGNEEPSYFALAKLMELIADADESDEQLYFLRTNVRFVVIPIINVWAVSNQHIRQNSTNTDLNRDFPNLTQAETQNVIAELRKYADDTCLLIDFHCASNTKTNDLYYNFSIQADNASVIFRTLNHLHHRQKELGYVEKLQSMAYVPGVYIKTWTTLQGRAYNEFGISTITAEHFMSTDGFPDGFSAEGMTWAVEAFGNMLIQNAYYYVEQASK